MNKLMPSIFLVATALLLFISWSNISKYNADINAEYERHIASAQEYMDKKILIDAVAEYKSALKMRPDNYEVALKIVDIYKELGMKDSYLKACDDAINADPSQWEPYLWLIDNYMNNSSYGKAYSYLKKAQKEIGNTEEISSRIIEILGRYNNISFAYDNLLGFVRDNKDKTEYSVIEKDGLYGILNIENKVVMKCEYEYIGLYMNSLIPIKKDDEYYYITGKGYRKVVPDEKADYLGAFNDGYGAAKIDGMYGYIDKKGKKHKFEYDYAGSFYNGIAPVKKGDKWAIINSSLKNVTDFIFDDVVMDAYGFCSAHGVFFAKKDGKYYLYNSNGEELSQGFDDAKLFASDQAAAVKLDGKWGFVSKTGQIFIEPKYEDADSFSIGYAPFYDGEKWGCIDETGTVIIEPVFDEMKPFLRNGYSFVTENEKKKFISVVTY